MAVMAHWLCARNYLNSIVGVFESMLVALGVMNSILSIRLPEINTCVTRRLVSVRRLRKVDELACAALRYVASQNRIASCVCLFNVV